MDTIPKKESAWENGFRKNKGYSLLTSASVFNYLPYRLTDNPFNLSTQSATLLYLAYVIGIFIGPAAGKVSNRMGSGNTLLVGSVVLGAALFLLLVPAIIAVVVGLLAICAGFFSVHAAAVGLLNRNLSTGQGRANALYVMFYYLGGWVGITVSGFIYQRGGWGAFVSFSLLILVIPVSVAIKERNERIDHL
jgi:YNFM family putative membrane transporter